MNNLLKICVGYHKPSLLLKGDCFIPVWGGKAVAKNTTKDGIGLTNEEISWMNKYCISDEIGDNLSSQNHHYCEASTLYWMWKNYDKLENPDYIGFLQYRRHFVLNDEYKNKEYKKNIYNLIYNDYFSDDHQSKIGLTQENLLEILKKYDGIFCTNDTDESVYNYKKRHHSQDIKYWNKTLEIIDKDWPQYAKFAREYNRGTKHVWSNCFVMKKEDFFEYCPFLFDVLYKIHNFASSEYKNMTAEQMRVPAYVSETMLGIFYSYLQTKNRSFKSVPLIFIKKPFEYTEVIPEIPQINKNAIPVVFATDKNYYLYLGVAIKSLVSNKKTNTKYDIIILEMDLEDHHKKMLCDLSSEDISIRVINVKNIVKKHQINNFMTINHIKEAAYYRLIIAEILSNYEKVIYLDCDLLVLTDLSDLYNIKLTNSYVGAVKDILITQLFSKDDTFVKYTRNVLNIENLELYFNSGVLVLNLDLMRKNNIQSKMLEVAKINNKYFHDQNVLNSVFNKNLTLLDGKYNVNFHLLFDKSRKNFASGVWDEYLKNIQSPKILHYTSKYKPWIMPSLPNADIWWRYARMTPFYEEILYKNCIINNIDIINYPQTKRKYRFYKLVSKITFGKTRKRYKQKCKDLKQKIKQVRSFLKGK